ncbi:family S53 protease [Dentipellis sp. KUC8613]|nr:family S53 protease [Dentipellis sp. KUC8613]
MVHALIFLPVLAALASASPHSARTRHLMHRRDNPPGSFVNEGPAPADQVFNLQFALVQHDFATLEKKLYAGSTPGSPEYGQYLTKKQVEALVAPAPESVSALDSWLSSHNLSSQQLSPSGDVRGVNLTVAQANELLSANYSTFVNQAANLTAVRTLSYSIPNDLLAHVTTVYPTTTFPVPPSGPARSWLPSNQSGDNCVNSFTPACIRQLYGLPNTPATQKSNRLGVLGTINEWFSDDDFRLFMQTYRPDLPPTFNYTVTSIAGGINNQSDPGYEASLDVQYTMGVAYGVPVEFLSVGMDIESPFDEPFSGSGFGEPFTKMINGLLQIEDLPQVMSISYAMPESYTDFATANHVCNGFAQLSARGISIFAGSADWGVTGEDDPDTCRTFTAMTPGSCPYITSVGGTQGVNPEVAWSEPELDEASGSGFSNFYPMPDYQKADVLAYQKTIPSSYDGLYNKSGRGYPDVSTRAVLVDVVIAGEFKQINGTSASTPMMASVAALLNDELIAAGKPVLGFMNPFIYANKDAFTDIVNGSNPGCNTNGFSATQGWDAITGVGTPLYPKLRSALGL